MKIKNSALTLVEIMISTVIIVIAFAILFQLQLSGSQYLAIGIKKTDTLNDSIRAFDTMEKELRLTQRGKLSLQNSSSIDFQVPVDTTGAFTYQGDTLTWGADGVEGRFIRYYLVNNTITRTTVNSSHALDANSTPTIIARNIQTLGFLYYGPSLEIIVVSQDKDSFNRLATTEARTTVSLRN